MSAADRAMAAEIQAYDDYMASEEHRHYSEMEAAAERYELERWRQGAVLTLAEAAEDAEYDLDKILLVRVIEADISDIHSIIAEVIADGVPSTLSFTGWSFPGDYENPPDHGVDVSLVPLA